jgi:hypothetical protein
MDAVTRSCVLPNAFTVEDMRHHAAEAWGQIGADIADTWRKLNAAYFDGALRPIPLIVSQTFAFRAQHRAMLAQSRALPKGIGARCGTPAALARGPIFLRQIPDQSSEKTNVMSVIFCTGRSL